MRGDGGAPDVPGIAGAVVSCGRGGSPLPLADKGIGEKLVSPCIAPHPTSPPGETKNAPGGPVVTGPLWKKKTGLICPWNREN